MGVLDHQLQGGELRRPRDHQKRKADRLRESQSLLGREHRKDDRKRSDHDQQWGRISGTAPERGFGGGG